MLRILFLSANPANTPPLAIKAEALAIEEKLRQASLTPNIEFHYAWGTTADEIEVQLRSFAPNILHFSGHGSKKGELVIQNSAGNGFALPTQALVQLLSLLGRQLRSVVLNACSMRDQAEQLAQHVDCVIGMDQAIRDTSALHFAASFYAALAIGDSLERAFQLGKARIRSSGAADAEAPQLFVRSGVDASRLRFVHKVQLFCIHTDVDRAAYREFSVWLKPLLRASLVELCGLHDLTPGTSHHELTETRFERAHIFPLLVSQAFLDSDECYEFSRRAMQRMGSHRVAVVPILIRRCDWQQAPFGGLQPLRISEARDGQDLEDRDSAWQNAIKDLRTVIREQERQLLSTC